jgi:hypothetical protein
VNGMALSFELKRLSKKESNSAFIEFSLKLERAVIQKNEYFTKV